MSLAQAASPPCLCSGPVLILALAREDAVEGWRQLLGPPSLEEAKETDPNSFRAQYSVDNSELNQLHCSDSAESAAREINYFFPPEQTVAVIKPNAFTERGELATYVCTYVAALGIMHCHSSYVRKTVYHSWYVRIWIMWRKLMYTYVHLKFTTLHFTLVHWHCLLCIAR